MTQQVTKPDHASWRKGEIAETLFMAGAMVHDWDIFVPLGHAHATDVCIAKPWLPAIKVQVKTAWHDESCNRYRIPLMKCNGRGKKQMYGSGDFDVLAGYLPDLNQFVLWAFDDISGRQKIDYHPDRHRQPSNWELLDDVAKSLTNSRGMTALVPPPSL
jgi:hypothetical protein